MSGSVETSASAIPLSSLRGGEMGQRVRELNWTATPLGDSATWPQSLSTLVEVILGSSQPMFVVWGPEHTLLYNDAYSHILAAKHPAALGRSFMDVWDEIRPDLTPIVAQAYRGEPVSMDDIMLVMHRKGYPEETHFAFSYTPVRAPDGRVGGFLCPCFETTAQVLGERARQRAEDALRELNETLEQQVQQRTLELNRLWDTSPDLLLVIDFVGVFRRVNPAWTTLLGYRPDELVGHHVNEFVIPDDHDETTEAYELAAEGGHPRIENRYRHKDGSIRWISWVAAPAGDMTYATGRDITVGKAQAKALGDAQEALRHAQKMEAVGQLTGGVAHDFNNLLTVIKSSTDLLKRPDLPEERRQRYIGAISDTVARAAKLTGQLLAFARRQALKPEVFDAGQSVVAISDMVGTLSGSRVRIVTDIPDEPCFINADPSQFDAALVNMAVNARDAMDSEGTLTITVHPVSVIPPIHSHPAVRGDFVAVCIEDTGAGIAPDQIEHIFEPFFTTKGVGHGTGLGLSQVFGFAKQSGGEVRVQSTVGQGTMFVLYLPRVEGAVHVPEAEPEPLVDGHGMCVLVVEDNADVGTFATQTLAELGYVTVWAADAEEALAELAKDADRFDVVFSDVVMPGMNGIDLAHRIRRDHHDLPVLLASGYSHVLAQNGTYGFELLHKPYSVEQLSRLLRKVATWQRRKRIMGR